MNRKTCTCTRYASFPFILKNSALYVAYSIYLCPKKRSAIKSIFSLSDSEMYFNSACELYGNWYVS
ncbi:unnamed protein product [Phytomonas sp. EM1]|nr:unnamed protein product [Phytomonas sp. EM1]|eukprot:CCW60373.1 unnamed protein product [Phytomonas sp. isolate EM1]